MSAEIINLRQARKAAKRREKDARASENRTRHGRTKEERERDRFERTSAERHIDDHRRETLDDGPMASDD